MRLPCFVEYHCFICGKISYVSGIVTVSVAAQRDLRGKSPRAHTSPPKQTVCCDRMITFTIRKSSYKCACGTATFGERLPLAANSISFKQLRLPCLVEYRQFICGKINDVSGIVALSVAAQRDLRGKSPRALSSLCGLRGIVVLALLSGIKSFQADK